MISAFTISKDGKYVATGQHGHKAVVHVWDSTTGYTLGTLPDLQATSVSTLAFSNSAAYLAVAGLDDDHTISVYDWQNGLLLARASTGRNHVLGCCFSDTDMELLTCGIKAIKLWSIKTRVMTCLRPTLSAGGGRLQNFLCCVYFMNQPVVGTADGNLYVFSNATMHHAVKAHDQGVYCIDVSRQKEQLVTGGKDGIVRLWNSDLECTREVLLESILPTANPRLRSVAFSLDASHLIIGTRGSEIMEILIRNGSLVGGGPLVSGHGCRELWGLASHPTKEEFVTVGDDATLRIWDSKSCSLIKTIKVDCPARAVAYSPDGKYLAIGFGSTRRQRNKSELKKEGAFVVLTTSDLKAAHEARDSNEPIRVVKFSPDSKLLAVASEDSKVYLYNVKDRFSKRCVSMCHKAPLRHLDFSQNGQFIISVDSSRRICFSESTSGAYISSAASLRDEKWSTWTCPVGWPVMGLWLCQPEGAEPLSVSRSWGGLLLSCGNSAGKVYVVYNPCPERSGFIAESGHAGPVSQVTWIAGDGTLLTVGAKDHAVMQWRCIYDNSRESADEGGISCEDSEVERDGGREPRAVVPVRRSTGLAQPWLSAVIPPTNIEDDDQSPPAVVVEPEFIHGMRIGDCRQTLCYNEDGHVVFIAATLGVVFDRDSQKQTIYQGHRAPLISLDVECRGKLAATGELADNPQVHVWDAKTAVHLFSIDGIHRRGVTSLSFSESAEYLATLGQDPLHSVVLLRSPSRRWTDGSILCSVSLTPSKMLWIKMVETNEFSVVVGGMKAMIFMRPSGRTMEKTKGMFGRRRKLQPVMCVVEGEKLPECGMERKLYSGTVTGHIYIWYKMKIETTVTAHDAPIFVISRLRAGFATGAKDGLVKLWSADFTPLHQYNTESFSPLPYNTSIHALRVNPLSSKLLVGKAFICGWN